MTAGNLFSFQGRIGRGPLWLLVLVGVLFSVVANLIIFAFGGMSQSADGTQIDISPSMFPVLGIFAILLVVLTIINLSFQVRRCHDRNRSGWFILLWALPILNIWGFIELYCLAGTPGTNQYGPDLSGRGYAQTGEVFR